MTLEEAHKKAGIDTGYETAIRALRSGCTVERINGWLSHKLSQEDYHTAAGIKKALDEVEGLSSVEIIKVLVAKGIQVL